MKQALWVTLFALAISATAAARDTVVNIPLADVLAMPDAKEKLDGSVQFFLAGQATPTIIKKMDDGVSNLKTSGVGKTDETACKWAALSALIQFQKSAKERGANAVVDMVSYYKKNVVANPVTFECHAGNIMTGVALKGTYAQIGS